MRRPARKAAFRLLRMSLVPLMVRRTLQRRRATLILYHDPDPQLFDRHLQVLRRLYSIVDLRTVVDALRSGAMARLPSRALVITFDDGHRRNRELLPVLERHGVPITIFLCASLVGNGRFWFRHVENPEPLKRIADRDRLDALARRGFTESGAGDPETLSDEEIRAMAGALVDFQSHGLTHPILPRCDDAKATAEIAESRAVLARKYGLDVYAFSYPNGDYTEREVRIAQEAGYLCGVTVDAGFNLQRTDPYRLKRIVIDDHDGIDELLVKASGLWGVIRAVIDRRVS